MAAAGLLAAAAASAQDLPRAVSMNLCTDQLAMIIAGDGQLLSVTHVSRDPRSSPLFREARGYPVNHGGAEEIFLMDPDVVLAGAHSDPAAVSMLRRLGIEVVQFPITTRLDEIPEQIRKMGEVLGRGARAEALASDVEEWLAREPVQDARRPVAAFFYPNGYSLGANTLGHDILSRAGFDNLAVLRGQRGGGRVPLEALVIADPDILITASPYPGRSRSEDVVRHPVLEGFAREGRIVLSTPEWVCGTSLTLRAVEALIDIANRVTERKEFKHPVAKRGIAAHPGVEF